MGEETFKSLNGKELRVTKLGIGGAAAQGETAGTDQGALTPYGAGANGLSAGADMEKLVKLVIEIRATLVANGMMKGGA